jgi:proteasome alpha subunit
MGAIGHPGDIERLRMTAIEVTGAEGFTRSSQDVSLRRLANYSLSPALKAAFEQIYGAPFLARMLFAELGRDAEPNLFVRVDYDGSIHTNGGNLARSFEDFGVISGTQHSTNLMEKFLRGKQLRELKLPEAIDLALDAWTVGHLSLASDANDEMPAADVISGHRKRELGNAVIEGAVLERGVQSPITFRNLVDEELSSFRSGV